MSPFSIVLSIFLTLKLHLILSAVADKDRKRGGKGNPEARKTIQQSQSQKISPEESPERSEKVRRQ
jgi:hypothetical protein